ncbi:MAG: MTH1187 family thiamine-binding protein [Thermoguttaceae bacterium]
MVLLEFSMYPLGRGESVSPYVARSLEIVQSSGLDYHCHAMGTVIEGEYDEVMEVVRRCFERMSEDCDRVECSIKLDFRRGRSGGLQGKLASVEAKLGRPVNRQAGDTASQ